MSRSDPYFQFPLCALAFGSTSEERFEHIMAYCAVDVGAKLIERDGKDKVELLVNGRLGRDGGPEDFEDGDLGHLQATLGLLTLGLSQRTIKGTLDQHTRLVEFTESFLRRNGGGKDASVRVRRDLLLGAASGKLKYATFSVFAAILSEVGEDKFRYVYREKVQHRALGYKTSEIMAKELPNRTDGVVPLKIHQISYQYGNLHKRGLVAKVEINPRQNIFSTRLSQAELEQLILNMERKRLGQKSEDKSAFAAKLKAIRGGSHL